MLLSSAKTEAGLDIRREDGMLQAIMFKSRSRMEFEDGRRRTVKLEAFRGLLLGYDKWVSPWYRRKPASPGGLMLIRRKAYQAAQLAEEVQGPAVLRLRRYQATLETTDTN